ncbi:MAG: hypothetical protein P8166_14450 [Candidatus Thiodiazotropha sp.]
MIVFALALGESLPVLGIVSPGTTVIMAIAALGYLPLWAVLAAAVLGAIAGDGISYWYDHRCSSLVSPRNESEKCYRFGICCFCRKEFHQITLNKSLQ